MQESSRIIRTVNAIFGNWRRTLLAIFIVALLIRGIFILTLQDGFYFPDSTDYSRAAISLITNGELGKTYNRPPGYPVFLAGIYMLFGESILAVRIVESFLGAFLAVVIALLGRRIGGEVVGALAGILWGIYPLGVFIAGLVYPTNLLTLLLAFGLLCFLPWPDKELSPKGVFLAGVLWGLAMLTIPAVMATVGAISIWMIWWGRRNRILMVSLLILGSALTVVPWTVRDFYVYDRLVLVEPRFVEHLPRMDKTQKNAQENKVETILKHPGDFAIRFGREFLHFWKLSPDRLVMDWPTVREGAHRADHRIVKETIFTKNYLVTLVNLLSTGPLFLFAIVGTIAMWLQPVHRRYLSLLWATILSFAGVYSLFYAKTRYRIPIEPYIIILSAYGLWQTWEWLRLRLSKFEVEAQAKVKLQAGVGAIRRSKF
jgi:4-amino-4-deoxy-L-arabinose transferase-like glycosyltransferase